MFMTPRKFRGWGAEIATHIPGLERMNPPRFILHLPHGTRNPKAMEFDAIQWAKLAASGPAPELRNIVNEDELVGACLTLYELFPTMQQDWYLGMFAASEIFTKAWDRGNFREWENRIDSCLRPLLKLKARGVPVGVWIDSISDKDKDSQDAHGFHYIRKKHEIPVGIETRPMRVAEWANKPDIPCLTVDWFWHNVEGGPNTIQAKDLLGPQWLICADQSRALVEMSEGRNVAFIGEFPATPVVDFGGAWTTKGTT